MNGIYRSVMTLGMVGLLTAVSSVRGQGVLGERYVGLGLGAFYPGDSLVEEVDDTLLTYGTGLRLPIQDQLDFKLSAGRAEIDGATDPTAERASIDLEGESTAASAGLNYPLKPGQKYNPYLAGAVSYVETEIRTAVLVNGFRDVLKEEDTGFSGGGGMEIALMENAALTPSVSYSKVGDVDEVSLGLAVGVWLNETFGVVSETELGLDDEDISVGGSLLVRF